MDLKNLDKKDKNLLMVAIIIVPVFVLFLILYPRNNEQQPQTVAVDDVLLMPEVDGEAVSSLSKREAYELAEKQRSEEHSASRKAVSSDRDFYDIDPDGEKTSVNAPSANNTKPLSSMNVDEEVKEVLQQLEQVKSEPQTAVQSAPKTAVKKAKTETLTGENTNRSSQITQQSEKKRNASEGETNSSPQIMQQPEKKRSSGITMVKSQSSTGVSGGTATVQKSLDKYTPAVLEQDKEIQNGSNIMFILNRDMTSASGVTFKKGSYLFGKAVLNSEFFDVQIYQIKNTDGNMHSVKMLVYDEYYNRGIRSEDMLTKTAKKEGVEEGANQARSAGSKTGLGLVDAGVNLTARTIQRTQQSKPVIVSLTAGYKVMIVEDEK